MPQPAACLGHLLAERVHEQGAVIDVHGAEVGPGLAADRIQRPQALLPVEVDQRRHDGVEVPRRRVGDLVQRTADPDLVAGPAAAATPPAKLVRSVRKTLFAS